MVATIGLGGAFCAATGIAEQLLREPGVADRWGQPSVLPRMSVGALACHLGRQPVRAAELLPLPTSIEPLGSVDDHYRRAAWVTAGSLDHPANSRTLDDEEAALGLAALVERVGRARRDVRDLLSSGAARAVVCVPWQGWSLRRDDFLVTRLVEIIVHSNDLAASIEIAAPEFPAEAFAPVRDLLARLAVERHGQSAVVATLTRRERAVDISAF